MIPGFTYIGSCNCGGTKQLKYQYKNEKIMSEKSNLIVTPNGVVETDGYRGSCSCGGTRNKKYQKGNYIIYFLPKRETYHIKENNNYIKKDEPIKTLCENLKSLGFPACAEHLSTN